MDKQMNTSKILEDFAKVLEKQGIKITNFIFDDLGNDVMFEIEGYKEDVIDDKASIGQVQYQR